MLPAWKRILFQCFFFHSSQFSIWLFECFCLKY
jgi:hypothetical protein